MKIKLVYASNMNREEMREVADLDALIALREEMGSDLILTDAVDEGARMVWVYDSYME